MAAQRSVSRMYSDIDPRCEWVQGEEFSTLLVDVSGFKKEELKAQVDTSRNLKVSGERNVEGNKWCRFQKSFQLPKACEISKIKAKFDSGVLYVMVPKTSGLAQTSHQDGNSTTTATPNGEQQPNESRGGSVKENDGYSQGEDMQQEFNNEKPAWSVARNLSKQKFVILNVVIAAILLMLVYLRRYKLADGDNIGNHSSSTLN
ncbi:hypothetical protein LUZ62_047969 [Rhynchospora pubera]|uniref:SHSP domain-containing protein n=1 Tax=Rhynchospora pubera TaxID=906938 RepID=A0AAV8C491_9POAL|nr:hypothetical protein LUZ62_084736 [Rhynchospora pubera]KAJ4796723.1 hypothetical protein LUZ62_047969 [Rhynchospora pubera]